MEEKEIPMLFGDLVAMSVPLPDAACKDKSTDLFFSHSHWVLKRAKQVCYGCPERIKCLDFALENKEDSGVWGGVIFRRGRPDQKDINYVRSLGDPEILREQIREQEKLRKEEEKKKKDQEKNESESPPAVRLVEKRNLQSKYVLPSNGKRSDENSFDRYPVVPYKSKNFRRKPS